MKATDLYAKLDKDFIKQGLTDDWVSWMDSDALSFTCPNWKERMMGLFVDNNTDEVTNVFTAVFPSDKVINEVLSKKVKNAVLFTHHPMVWDINKDKVFSCVNKKLLEKLKAKNISIYTLHVPLDDYGMYSTGVSLAQALGLRPVDKFGLYYGAYAGVIANSVFRSVKELVNKVQLVLGHDVKSYNYGSDDINNERVAIVAGGGLSETINELVKLKVKVLVTGISVLNNFSREAHNLARENKMSIIGGTHYSTEKFACISMCAYFKKLKLHSEFISDDPCMNDL
ncbi:MAG TPA: Nif3-like dinuclear metal center hexameric protein [Candidatus Nanoarchaeia archaeon]|nr:Nif3-like dinuclear metal center hexameric protein [Candidatus Nanoarchaeia archaeon]